MAAANITVTGNGGAQIESDTTGAVITFGSLTERPPFQGELRNMGQADVFGLIGLTATAAVLASVVTDGTQTDLNVRIPAGGGIPILRHYKSLAHKTVAGTAELRWTPNQRGEE